MSDTTKTTARHKGDASPNATRDSSPNNVKMMEEELLRSPTSSTGHIQENISKLQIKDDRVKLNGAARKRFKWLVKNGLKPDEARIKAMEPMKDKGPKRTRSDGSTPESSAKKPRTDGKGKTSSGGLPPPGTSSKPASFKQVVLGTRIGILHSTYPESYLETEQLKLIQDAILARIVKEAEGSVKPKFLGTTFKSGCLIVNCADKATGEWLKAKVGDLKPWEGATLKAVEEKDLPRSSIINAFFPNSKTDSNDQILKFVKGQNEGLNTTEWRVLKRAEEGSSAHLTLSVDQSSIESLKKADFKISYKFGQTTLRQKGNKPDKKPAQKRVIASTAGEQAAVEPPPPPSSKPPEAKNNICRLCEEDEETSEHIVCECPAVASTTKTQCSKDNIEQTCSSSNIHMNTISTNRKDDATLETDVQHFEEIYIKEEPLEENTSNYEYTYDDLKKVIKEESDRVKCENDNKNEIDSKEENAIMKINERNMENSSDKEDENINHNCPFCNKVFAVKRNLKRHLNNDTKVKQFVCPMCNITFTQKCSLKKHVEEYHSKGKSNKKNEKISSELNFSIEEICIKQEVIERDANDSSDDL